MQAIQIGVGSNDHAMEFQAANIKHITGTRTQHIDDCAYLFIFDDTPQFGFGNIERFAFQLENSLKLRETPLTSTATSRVALDDEQFGPFRIVS